MFGMLQRITNMLANEDAIKKKLNLSFEVGYLDLVTVGMDFLHCLCGGY